MTNPQHFSLELPQRCQQLIRDLYPDLPYGEDCGDVPLRLRATFLLAMSMPMINLPLERINRYRDAGEARRPAAQHLNDSPLNPIVAAAIRTSVDGEVRLRDAPFFRGTWRYMELPRGEDFPNLAMDGIPEVVANRLADGASDAGSISSKLFCEILRNSLAHGGILFLNEHGVSSRDDPVRMFAFVSTNRQYNPTSLHFLRVDMRDYRLFLETWTSWLRDSGVQRELEDRVEITASV